MPHFAVCDLACPRLNDLIFFLKGPAPDIVCHNTLFMFYCIIAMNLFKVDVIEVCECVLSNVKMNV